jgi:predicted flap endonuclease-1-like 5' DNA nuclease
VEEPEPEPEAEAEPEAEKEPEAEAEEASEPVQDIKGIGPAYAERLSELGIETVDELADADSATVAEETDISETRIEQWIKRARARR